MHVVACFQNIVCTSCTISGQSYVTNYRLIHRINKGIIMSPNEKAEYMTLSYHLHQTSYNRCFVKNRENIHIISDSGIRYS